MIKLGVKIKKETVLDLLYPRRCPFCQEIAGYGRLICKRCETDIPYIEEPACMKCGKPLQEEEEAKEYCMDCQRHERNFERNYGLLRYNEKARKSIYRFKYGNRREYADWYAREIVRHYKRQWEQIEFAYIVPVPIHKKKRRQRGYNQAEVFGKKLGELLGVPCLAHGLLRVIDTRPQKELDNKGRYKNLKKAFSVGELPEGEYNILLVDDIYTTGATMEACTSVLLEQDQVKKVYTCTICVGNGF